MTSVLQDLKFGARILLREKGFTTICLLTLALCIGANTTIFSVVNRVLLRPLPYPQPERMVEMYNAYPNVGVEKGGNGVPDYLDRSRETAVFEAVALLDFDDSNVGEQGSTERVRDLAATPEIFSVLGLTPALGRPFTQDEAVPGHSKVVLLGHAYWQEHFGGSAAVLGQSLRVNGEPHEILGVLPQSFDFLESEAQLLRPMAFTDEQKSDDSRHSNFARMIARLQPGVTLKQAQERIDALNTKNLEIFPKYADLLKSANFHTVVAGLYDEMVQDVRPILYLLQWGVLFVLLIGCVNVANLVLIRSSGRTQELAVRFALGASRLRVARQLLTESVLLGLAGGVLGILLAIGGTRAMPLFGVGELPRSGEIGLDAKVLAFALGLSVFTGLLFGTIPVLQLLRGRVSGLLRQSGRNVSPGRSARLTRAFFVLAQVSLAFVLLIGAGLLLFSFRHVLAVDPGFQPRGVLSAQVSPPESRYPKEADQSRFAQRLLAEIQTIPGVNSASLTNLLPFTGSDNASVIMIEGRPLAPGELPPVPHNSSIDPGYFKTLGIPLLQGRAFQESDTGEAEKVAIVDREFARRYFPDGEVLGKRVRFGTDEPDNESPWLRIVGVAGPVRLRDLDGKDDVGWLYMPYLQNAPRHLSLLLRSTLPESQLQGPLRAAILRADPELPLYDVLGMQERVDRSLVRRRAPMMLLLVFAGIALMLSSIGIYGVLAYSVTQQTKEIGIRLALGASPAQVLRRVLWRGGRLVLLGLGLGLAGSLAMTRLMQSLLFEVHPTDPAVFTMAAGILGAVGLLACLLPSLQATRVDPTVTLRYE